MAEQAPESGVDFDRANAARMYDYYLGGAHNFAVDRELADEIIATAPGTLDFARGNRRFLMRAVEYCASQGIRQFLDLGSGIPTSDHVHTTARAVVPDARVAYVDFEAVAVAHSREILASVDGVTMTRADVRDHAAVLSAPTVTDVIDFSRPVALLAVAILHFIPDADDPPALLDRYRDALAPGSHLVISHGSTDYADPALSHQVGTGGSLYRRSATPIQLRSRTQIESLFGGHCLAAPGLVDIARWRSGDPAAAEVGAYGGAARLR